MKYIPAEKLIAEIEKRMANIKTYCLQPNHDKRFDAVPEHLSFILSDITSLQQENEIIEFSFKGGTYKVNGEEKSFKGGKAKVIILEINQEEE